MARRRRGPSFKYSTETAALVMGLAQYASQELIADELGMCVETLVKLYKEELKKGNAKAGIRIGKTLVEKALAGDTACVIFYCKTRLGMKETQVVDNTSSDGSMSAPMAVNIKFIDKGADDS